MVLTQIKIMKQKNRQSQETGGFRILIVTKGQGERYEQLVEAKAVRQAGIQPGHQPDTAADEAFLGRG